jgi:signal transduction histidine kinase
MASLSSQARGTQMALQRAQRQTPALAELCLPDPARLKFVDQSFDLCSTPSFSMTAIFALRFHRPTSPKTGDRRQMGLVERLRLTTMGEMAASIAHELNQPLAGMVTNANASLRWLAGESPNLAEAREAAGRIVRDGTRAGDVIARLRALFKKADPAKDPVDINQAIEEVVTLAKSEIKRNKVSLRMELAANLAPVMGDRVQLQQVFRCRHDLPFDTIPCCTDEDTS